MITETIIKPLTHEEALRVMAEWTRSLEQIEPNSIRTRAFRKLLDDHRKTMQLLDALACHHDTEAVAQLRKFGSYTAFDEPSSVKLVHEFIAGL